MAKILIVYDSRKGNTEKMAEFIAEGIRIKGDEATVKAINSIKKENALQGYDGYVFGCPTYHRDITGPMKSFFFLVEKANLADKVGGAFGSYTHSGDAPAIIFDTMEHVFKMNMTNLGSFNLKEDLIGKEEGLRACQDYGKAISEKIGG